MAPSGYYAVINVSGGGSAPLPNEEKEIRRLSKSSTLFVAAAGNLKQDISINPFYPASYVYKKDMKIVVVGNGKSYKSRAKLSNYGPGLTWYNGESVTGLVSTMSGTSMSAPKFTHDWLKRRCNESL
jgi:subtilisin family serine protease